MDRKALKTPAIVYTCNRNRGSLQKNTVYFGNLSQIDIDPPTLANLLVIWD